jgi:hypothetical protein
VDAVGIVGGGGFGGVRALEEGLGEGRARGVGHGDGLREDMCSVREARFEVRRWKLLLLTLLQQGVIPRARKSPELVVVGVQSRVLRKVHDVQLRALEITVGQGRSTTVRHCGSTAICYEVVTHASLDSH